VFRSKLEGILELGASQFVTNCPERRIALGIIESPFRPRSDVKVVHMSWSGHGPGGRRGYHHGNLREALIEAALDLIATKGPGGFTFADAARSGGVSAAAPYRHFRDRDALLADVARRGFELFAARLNQAWSDGRPDPVTAFENVGRAYLAFARDEPAYYSAMVDQAGHWARTDRSWKAAAEWTARAGASHAQPRDCDSAGRQFASAATSV
jgi:AcrR family transcriptional regulator